MICSVHPTYRGIVYPSSGCPACLIVYQLAGEGLEIPETMRRALRPKPTSASLVREQAPTPLTAPASPSFIPPSPTTRRSQFVRSEKRLLAEKALMAILTIGPSTWRQMVYEAGEYARGHGWDLGSKDFRATLNRLIKARKVWRPTKRKYALA